MRRTFIDCMRAVVAIGSVTVTIPVDMFCQLPVVLRIYRYDLC